MIKIDLVTGFLGSGKTTFIKEYARYLIDQGNKVGIIENDYGAVNVDMMLLDQTFQGQLEIEMIAGGCDEDCHRRRFKTKLIAMKMQGFDHIIVEPSGIYDVDEFFDVLHEDPLSSWYEIGSVITIVNAKLSNHLSLHAKKMLASQIANAGTIILSRVDEASQSDIEHTLQGINEFLKQIQCRKCINKEDVLIKKFEDFTDDDYQIIEKRGYKIEPYVKDITSIQSGFESTYFLHVNLDIHILKERIKQIFNDPGCGQVLRIKGFIEREGQWLEINATDDDIITKPIDLGQQIIIVIGEKLNKEKIERYLK